ncbi:MAG: hypothetical protein OEZ51_03570 [Nitrospinota bacterium]|nr:hypothetical protein [Nitrospinota bacterium]
MISGSSNSNNKLNRPVFIVSHARQEEVCKEVYDYLICKKLLKLKEAVLHFNKVIRQILK